MGQRLHRKIPLASEIQLKHMAEKRVSFESDGLRLVGVLEELSGEKGEVITHPHPFYGGSMHNNGVKAIAAAYQDNG